MLAGLCPDNEEECIERLKQHCPDLDEKCLANLSQMDYYLVGRENFNLTPDQIDKKS